MHRTRIRIVRTATKLALPFTQRSGEEGAVVERRLAILEEVVESWQDVTLDLLHTLENEHVAVARRGDGRLVDESQRALDDLATLLQVGLGRVACERQVAARTTRAGCAKRRAGVVRLGEILGGRGINGRLARVSLNFIPSRGVDRVESLRTRA